MADRHPLDPHAELRDPRRSDSAQYAEFRFATDAALERALLLARDQSWIASWAVDRTQRTMRVELAAGARSAAPIGLPKRRRRPPLAQGLRGLRRRLLGGLGVRRLAGRRLFRGLRRVDLRMAHRRLGRRGLRQDLDELDLEDERCPRPGSAPARPCSP